MRRTVKDNGPRPVDMHVGKRIRLARTLRGMSQQKVAEAIGITFQQQQKNERGFNRVGASRLFDLSRILDVPVSFFFDDMPENVSAASPAAVASGAVVTAPDITADPAFRRQSLELVRNFYAIPSDAVRKSIYATIKAAAGAANQES